MMEKLTEVLLISLAGRYADQHDGRVLRNAARDTLTVACEATGLIRHHVHDVRHDGISYLVRHGVKAQSIQKWAGHSSLSVTLDIYYRTTSEDDSSDKDIMCYGSDTRKAM